MANQTKTPPVVCQHDNCENEVICFILHYSTQLYEGYCKDHAKENGMCSGCGKALTPDQLDEYGWCAQCSIHANPNKRRG